MNFTLCKKIFIKIVFTMIIVSFSVFSLFGIVISVSEMKMNSDGTMNDCFLMTQTSMCTMSLSEHLNLWQSMFNTLMPTVSLMSILILALALVFKKILFNNNVSVHPEKFLTLRYKLYLKQHPLISLFNHLKEALSNGILNPKIYSLAI